MIDFKLYKHQQECIDRAKDMDEFALLMDLGTGKTLCVIQLVRHKWNQNKKILKTLVVCPLAVTRNWKKEFMMFSRIDKEMVTVLEGSSSRKVEQLRAASGVVITNIDSFSRETIPAAIKGWAPDILILDESHQAKTPTSKRSKNLYDIAKGTRYRYILTGTPILNSPMDIFQQYKILDLGATFGTNFFVFRSTYFYDKNARWVGKQHYFPDWHPIVSRFPELTEKIYAKGMRVLKSECLDLPPVVYQDIEVDLSKQQQTLYQQMKDNFIAFIEKEGKVEASTASIALVKALRFQQIVSGHLVLENGELVEVDCSPRIDALINCLQNILPQKVIIWCMFKHDYKIIKKVLTEMSASYVMLTGEESGEQKQAAIDCFQNDPTMSVLVANPASGGTGTTLTAAGYDITWSRGFNMAHAKQSHDRNHRIGSEIHKQIVKIRISAKNTVDEVVTKSLTSKQELSDIIIDYVKGVNNDSNN